MRSLEFAEDFGLRYAILDWLSSIVNCYTDQNRDAIVYSLIHDVICMARVVDDEPINRGNERSKYQYYNSI